MGISSRQFRIEGSPYEWGFRAHRVMTKGEPPQPWSFSIFGFRSHISEREVYESLGWSFSLPPEAVRLPEDLRPAHIEARPSAPRCTRVTPNGPCTKPWSSASTI